MIQRSLRSAKLYPSIQSNTWVQQTQPAARAMSQQKHTRLTASQPRSNVRKTVITRVCEPISLSSFDVFDANITDIRDITPTVKQVSLQTKPDGFSFVPGQWVDFFIPGLEVVGGYSLTSCPTDSPVAEIAVKFSRHPPAAWVHREAAVGKAVRLRVGGKFGDNFLDPTVVGSLENRHILFVAGGIGITPIISMLRALHHMHTHTHKLPSTARITLLYSAKTEEEFAFRKEIEDICADMDENCAVRFTCTQQSSSEDSTDDGKPFAFGRITSDTIAWALSNSGIPPDRSSVYLCGPSAMNDRIAEACAREGIKNDHIHFEKWW